MSWGEFLRFDDEDVKEDIEYVLDTIEDWIKINGPTPDPSQEGTC